jgi:hypothetical protein
MDQHLKQCFALVNPEEAPLLAQAITALFQVDAPAKLSGYLARAEAIWPADLALSAAALQALGFQGKELGEIQKKLLGQLYLEPSANRADALQAMASELKGKSF